jgi:GT2 family glycosyltransferase
VSIIIIGWNHRRLLPDCLDAVQALDYAPLDITVVDNGSQDGSPEWITRQVPAVRLWAFPDNRGFAHAFNWGVDHTGGDLVLSLNPDTVVEKGFLTEMVQVAEQGQASSERIGSVTPKLLRADNPAHLDSTGLFINRRRCPYDRGQGEPDRGQYDSQLAVFGACGAAALYRRTMLEDLALAGQYFDEGFFAYYEDADLAWRAQLRGWRCAYAPRAIATHARGWGDTLRKGQDALRNASGPRLALRNRYLMTIKNDVAGYLLADLPLILAAELPRLAYAAVTRPKILLGLVDLMHAVPSALRKRHQVRAQRTVDDALIRRWFVAPESQTYLGTSSSQS